jgi:prevent-host-death family protein
LSDLVRGPHRDTERRLGENALLDVPNARVGPAGEHCDMCGMTKTANTDLFESDNLIPMSEVTATEAARKFADLLDAVEHDGERYTITRRGRAVAHIEPITRGRGSDAKALLRRNRPDARWGHDLNEVRDLLEVETRP